LFVNGRYAANKLKTALTEIDDWTIEVIKRPYRVKGFVVISRRWVAWSTFAWLNRSRHFAREFRQTIASAFTASVQMLARRIAE
jgi:transposase